MNYKLDRIYKIVLVRGNPAKLQSEEQVVRSYNDKDRAKQEAAELNYRAKNGDRYFVRS